MLNMDILPMKIVIVNNFYSRYERSDVMERAFIKLVVAFIWWQLYIGRGLEEKFRTNVVQQLRHIEKVVSKESEE